MYLALLVFFGTTVALALIYLVSSVIVTREKVENFRQECEKRDKEFFDNGTVRYNNNDRGGIVIAGLGRNCLKGFRNFKNFAASLNADQVFVLENGSRDGSKEFLQEWESEKNSNLVLVEPPDITDVKSNSQKGKGNKRIERMVMLRNTLLQKMRKFYTGKNGCVSTVIMADIDLDMIFSVVDIFERIETLHSMQNIHVMVPNVRSHFKVLGIADHYRDSYAVSAPQYNLLCGSHKTGHPMGNKAPKLCHVESAFGGLGLYKAQPILWDSKIVNYRAEPHPNRSKQTLCEHIGFHRQLGGVLLDSEWKILIRES